MTVQSYEVSHAQSIAKDLFGGIEPDVVIQQREELFSPGPEEIYGVCCLSGDVVVGICTGVRGRWFGEKHQIEMIQVVVQEEFRNLGIARLMMKEIAKHFKQLGVEIVRISAADSNTPALNAYQRIGFVRFGFLKNGIKYGKDYSNEVLLATKIENLLEN